MVNSTASRTEATTEKDTEANTQISAINLSNDVKNLSKQLLDVQDRFSQGLRVCFRAFKNTFAKKISTQFYPWYCPNPFVLISLNMENLKNV